MHLVNEILHDADFAQDIPNLKALYVVGVCFNLVDKNGSTKMIYGSLELFKMWNQTIVDAMDFVKSNKLKERVSYDISHLKEGVQIRCIKSIGGFHCGNWYNISKNTNCVLYVWYESYMEVSFTRNENKIKHYLGFADDSLYFDIANPQELPVCPPTTELQDYVYGLNNPSVFLGMTPIEIADKYVGDITPEKKLAKLGEEMMELAMAFSSGDKAHSSLLNRKTRKNLCV